MSRFFVFLSTFIICIMTAVILWVWLTGAGPGVRAFFQASRPPIPAALEKADPNLAANLKVGDAEAEMTIARMYFTGTAGIGKDENAGAAWVRHAAQKGSRRAAGLLGILYLGGIGVEQDIAAAQKWLFLAHDANAGELAMRLKILDDALQKLPEQDRIKQRKNALFAARQDIRMSFTKFLETGTLSVQNVAPIQQAAPAPAEDTATQKE